MSMYSHRGMGAVPPGNARLNELLEQIRAEFDSQQRQSENFEHQSTLPSQLQTPLPPRRLSCAMARWNLETTSERRRRRKMEEEEKKEEE
ncbi:hypothetical protein V8C34DRAFT_280987 [Trichoderma compactum]